MEQTAFTGTTDSARGGDSAKEWFELLTSLGMPWQDAVSAALHPHLDAAAVVDLVYRGCPPQTALAIIS